MLNIKYIVTTILLFTMFQFTLHGQKQVIPGYQGKRMTVGLYYNVMSSFAGPNAKGKSIRDESWEGDETSTSPLALSGRFDVNFSYVFSRRFTGTVEFGNGKTGLRQAISLQSTNGQSFGEYGIYKMGYSCLLYTSPSPRDATLSRMPSSA